MFPEQKTVVNGRVIEEFYSPNVVSPYVVYVDQVLFWGSFEDAIKTVQGP